MNCAIRKSQWLRVYILDLVSMAAVCHDASLL